MNAANALTIFRIAATPVFVVLLFRDVVWSTYAATFLFLVAGLSDWLDGYLARKKGLVTRLGRFLDPLADKVLTSSAFISLALLKLIAPWMVLTMIIREIVVTVLRIYAISKKHPLITSRLAKWKTSSQMFVIFLILLLICYRQTFPAGNGDAPSGGDWTGPVINIMVFIVMTLAITTGVHYLVQNLIFPRRQREDRQE